MPQNPAQVQARIAALKAARDAMDAANKSKADDDEAAAVLALAQADALDDDVVVHQQRLQSATNDNERLAEARDVRVKSAEAKALRAQGQMQQINAARLRSLAHPLEATLGHEICVDCQIVYDNDGMIVAAKHLRFQVEDSIVEDPLGGPPINRKGLKTRIANDEIDLDPADGKLRVNGRRVGRN